MNNQYNALDIIAIASFILQLQNNDELQKQTTNDDIMGELHTQNTKYLQTIISQNDQIIKLMQKLLNSAERSTL